MNEKFTLPHFHESTAQIKIGYMIKNLNYVLKKISKNIFNKVKGNIFQLKFYLQCWD